MTRNQAAAQVRAAANAIIEQRTRQANGLDKGRFRDDDVRWMRPIEWSIREYIRDAMEVVNLAR